MRFPKVIIKTLCTLFLGILLLYPFSSLFAAGIKIVSPSDGTVVHPGETVTIAIEVLDSDIDSVLLVSPAGAKKIQSFPAHCDIVISEGVLGSTSIAIAGKNSQGEFFLDKITLTSQSLAVLKSINVSPDKIYFDWPNKNVQLTVKGIYADGKTYYITPADMGTIYYSSDSSVATVDENGSVISKGNGRCTITISNSGTLVDIPIEVSLPKIIPATIDISPEILYLKNKEEPITCYIELPQDYYVQDINIETISLNEAISCTVSSAQIGDYNNNSIVDLTVKFGRQDLWYFLERGEQVSIAISGEVGDKYFRGTDTVKVLNDAPTVESTIEIQPDKWNIHWLKKDKEDEKEHQGKGKIKCYIGNIAEHTVDDILPETILLNNTVSISEQGKKEKLDAKIKKHRKEFEGEVLEVTFNKFEAIKSLGEIKEGDIITVIITGKLSDGKTFKGEDTIQIIGKDPEE